MVWDTIDILCQSKRSEFGYGCSKTEANIDAVYIKT